MFFLLLSTPAEVVSETLPPLNQILTKSELRNFQKKTKYRSRMKLFQKVLKRHSVVLRTQLKKMEVETILKVVLNLRSLSHHALDQKPLSQKESRSKEVKKLEISLRQLVDVVENLKLSVAYKHREKFELTIKSLKKIRSRLLKQLFGQAGLRLPISPRQNSFYSFVSPTAASWRVFLPQSRDGFSDEEYANLQRAQKLNKRVNVFLDIAEDRLDKLEERWARMKNSGAPVKELQETTDEKKEVLEFHAYWEFLHSYERAIDGSMINIDEKAEKQLLPEKEILKILKDFCKKVRRFSPRLDAIGKIITEPGDEDFQLALKAAKKTTEIAQKGCQLGLEKEL